MTASLTFAGLLTRKTPKTKKKRQSRSGIRGVYQDGAQWIAVIGVNGKRIHLGFFANPTQANDAYLAARRELFTFQPEPRP